LTIKACADSTCSTEYAGEVSGTLTATGTPTVNWDGTTGGASGAGFVIAAGSGSVTKKVQVTTPGSVDFGVTNISPTPSSAATCSTGSSTSCTFTAEEAGFLLDVPDHVSEVQQTLTIKAVKQSDSSLSCVPAFASVSKTVNLKCAYVNPSSGTLPVRVADSTLAGSATSACSSTGADISLTFDATGTATPALQYADVGEMKIDAAYAGTSGTEAGLSMVGNTQFIAAPASFAFSDITTGTIKAGAAFSATLTAVNDIGTATPNFGKEAAPEGATLSANLVSPSPGNNPALSNGAIAGSAFSNGVASLSNLSWGEVGTITLTATLTSTLANSGTYLGSGITTEASTSVNIGRFIPNHFDTVVSGGMTCPVGLICPTAGFVYSAQAFTAEVLARNVGGGTTLNYDHARAHANEVTLTAWDAAGSTTDNNPNDGVMSGNTVAASEFLLGEAAVSTPAYALPNPYPSATAPPAPTDIYVRASESAADGVTSLRGVASVEGGIAIVSGRAFIRNAYGSELLRLPIDFTVQYWNGANWVTSETHDTSTSTSASSFGPGDVDFINCTLNLVDATATTSQNCKSVVQVASSPSSIAVTNGVGLFVLNAPGSGNNGSADLRLSAPSHLPSTTARARFGINKGRLIYLREMY
jgi:MSHA biogenesis protein MshQ